MFMLMRSKWLFVGASLVATLSAGRSARAAGGDFDGDGRADLAIAAPFEDVGSVADAFAYTGAVMIRVWSRISEAPA